MSNKFQNIIHLPYVVGGNPCEMSAAEKKLGYHSETLNIGNNLFQYPCDHLVYTKSPLQKLFNVFIKIHWMLTIPHHYDVVHYNFGSSLAPRRLVINDSDSRLKRTVKQVTNGLIRPFEHWDVKWAKLRGCKIYVTYQGDDARQRDYCLANFPISHVERVDENYYSVHGDALKRSWIATFDKLADRVFSLNPDLCWVLPERTEFLPYGSVDAKQFTFNPAPNSVPKILHAPSNRAVKGTDTILRVLDELQSDGYKFELVLVENLPNHVAKKIYEDADILIDQLYVGWYGALAVELMAMGKVVMAYLRESDLVHIPEEMRAEMAVINSSEQNLKQQLVTLLTMTQQDRRKLGEASLHYAEKWHDPLKLVSRMHQ